MEPTKVGVIGAGMAGPVLALFLKLQGYSPIVYERNDGPSDGGLGITYDSFLTVLTAVDILWL